jgi:hypothetical protein
MTDQALPPEDSSGEIADAVRSAIEESMPDRSQILQALTPDPLWSPVPPGSHLRLDDDGHRGVGVVAIRSSGDSHGEAMTENGDILELNRERRLRIGP